MKTLILLMLILFGISIFCSNDLNASLPVDDSVNKLERVGGGKLLADWIDIQLFAISNTKFPSHHTRQSAYSAIALYESLVKGDLQYQSLTGQLNELNLAPTLTGNIDVCWPASGNAALAEMYRYFYSDNPVTIVKIDSMENNCKSQFLTGGYNEASVKMGIEYGKTVAKAIIEWSKTDGDDKASDPYTIPKGLGLWEPTPPKFTPPILPYMGNDRTFVKVSIEKTLPPQPTSFSIDSLSPFYKMVNEVYQTGKHLDNEKQAIALFWDDSPNGKSRTGGGHWASILKNLIISRNLSLIESAQIYAEMFIAMNDAAIGCFNAKYNYNLLRPVTFVQKYIDPSWNSFIVTPPHPEYPAAHATVSRSAAIILTHLLGNNVGFVDHTYDYKGYSSRTFKNFLEASTEAGMSRLYGGIHYMPSIEAGFTQGEKIANNVLKALAFKKTGDIRSKNSMNSKTIPK